MRSVSSIRNNVSVDQSVKDSHEDGCAHVIFEVRMWRMAKTSAKELERRKKKYHDRVKNGLCPCCGKPVDRYAVYCSKCAEKLNARSREYRRTPEALEQYHAHQRIYDREKREYLKEIGVCKCGKEVAIGFTSCPDCLEKDRQKKEQKRVSNRQEYNEYMKEYRKNQTQKRRAEGLCTRCGKKLTDTSKATCAECRVKMRKQKNKRNAGKIPRSEWIENGMCYHCGKPVMDGKKVCPECYERNMKLLEKANASPAGIEAKRQYEERFYRRMMAARKEKEWRNSIKSR